MDQNFPFNANFDEENFSNILTETNQVMNDEPLDGMDNLQLSDDAYQVNACRSVFGTYCDGQLPNLPSKQSGYYQSSSPFNNGEYGSSFFGTSLSSDRLPSFTRAFSENISADTSNNIHDSNELGCHHDGLLPDQNPQVG